MSTSTIILILAGIVLIILVIFVISFFNDLTKKRILTQEATAGIGASLQQRNDLIPNLVEIVKGYAGHEKSTFEEVTKWRNQSAAATTIEEQNAASKGLNHAMVNLLAVVENYPDLKADTQFRELMNQLSRIEDKINDSRRYYNGTVRQYNQSIGVFPKNLVAGSFNFKPAAFFAEDIEAKIAPQVKFNNE